jgi:hypothetical protein
MQASDFLQKNGKERTGLQRKEEVRDIDLDNNDRIAFIEYLLLHFKAMILSAYFKRTNDHNPFDLSEETNPSAIGITGIGHQLLDELFTLPVGLPAELIAAIEEFTAKKQSRETRLKTLEKQAENGGVKGLAAKNEIEQMNAEDQTSMNRLEITLNGTSHSLSSLARCAHVSQLQRSALHATLERRRSRRRRRSKRLRRRRSAMLAGMR